MRLLGNAVGPPLCKQIPNIQSNLSNPEWLAVDEQINHPGENIVYLVVKLAAAGLVKAWYTNLAVTDQTMSPAIQLHPGTRIQWKDGRLHMFVPTEYEREILYYHFQHSKDIVLQTYNSLLLGASHVTVDPRTGFVDSAYFDPARHVRGQGEVWAGPGQGEVWAGPGQGEVWAGP